MYYTTLLFTLFIFRSTADFVPLGAQLTESGVFIDVTFDSDAFMAGEIK